MGSDPQSYLERARALSLADFTPDELRAELYRRQDWPTRVRYPIETRETEYLRVKFGIGADGRPYLVGPESATHVDRAFLQVWAEYVTNQGLEIHQR